MKSITSPSKLCITQGTVSRIHLKVYSVIFDPDFMDDIGPLVYAEDLSRNGTRVNGSYIGKDTGARLLGNGNCIAFSTDEPILIFKSTLLQKEHIFDELQTRELEVSSITHQLLLLRRSLTKLNSTFGVKTPLYQPAKLAAVRMQMSLKQEICTQDR